MDLVEKYLGEAKVNWKEFYDMAKDTSGKTLSQFEKKYGGNKFQMPHIRDALKKSKDFSQFMKIIKKFNEESINELTKKDVFTAIEKRLGGNDWMDMSVIGLKMNGFPMSKMGVEAHIRELVRKGKAKESIKRGKAIYKIPASLKKGFE